MPTQTINSQIQIYNFYFDIRKIPLFFPNRYNCSHNSVLIICFFAFIKAKLLGHLKPLSSVKILLLSS
ncbi:hypothetical protein BpHYR1_045850 [Brachionus plicatilis]|uniref:Uncharacterized protein n=1 Tax=Brachionus plicatilis TaxID=10195 RepID=A0A3M7RBF3_BRAPC|nr:hypothetical protein BpHYR1_045850 [Brachionus plicatilis]